LVLVSNSKFESTNTTKMVKNLGVEMWKTPTISVLITEKTFLPRIAIGRKQYI